MARISRDENRLDSPKGLRSNFVPRFENRDRFGRFTEWIARNMGTPAFLVILTAFAALWIAYNIVAPHAIRFDEQDQGFTVLTLILSLQASYAAPLILLAQNRQAERDRREYEQDRRMSAEMRAETDFLVRELAAARLALGRIEAAIALGQRGEEERVEA